MLLFSRRNHIIKKALSKTVLEFSDRIPKLYDHFFYGAVDIGPQNLAVWYLFETEAELEIAKASGLCNELREATITNLISLGYPQEAFNLAYIERPTEIISFQGGSEEKRQELPRSPTKGKVTVLFTTIEDIDNKANGDFRLYFQ